MILTVVVAVLIVIFLIFAAFIAWAFVASRYNAPVTADEVHMVTTSDLWRIRLCRHTAKKGPGYPVFMCHGFMSNQWNFAIPPGECMADLLAEQGYDCWLIDLRGARSSIPPFGRSANEPTVDDYLLKDIPAAIEYIRKITGFDKVHWVGHSMGGMLLYAYDAVFGLKYLASGTTLGSPIGFEGVEFHRPGFLLGLRRVSRHLFRAVQRILIVILVKFHPEVQFIPINWKNMNRKIDTRALFGTLEAPPVAVAEALASAAETGKWRVKNDTVEVFDHLKNLRVPLFAIFGAGDPFVPFKTIQGLFDRIPIKDKKLLILSKENGHAADYSHVDLAMGSEIGVEVVPPVIEWFQSHPIGPRSDSSEDEKESPARAKPKKPAARKRAAKQRNRIA